MDVSNGEVVYTSEARSLYLMMKDTSITFKNVLLPGKKYEISLIPEDLCADEVEILDISVPTLVREEIIPSLSRENSLQIVRGSEPITVLLLGLPGVGKILLSKHNRCCSV
eukprot:TRINITY_DN1243_c0_g1_i1.p1 TRINITY_DN1243_c0_g1~~TRINITY_DN1243_c0_g1_i1.p1  ORF type:complete len:111 (+),score=10.55 TRINITY_DN1243_c0_g1_i1:381-713(+)